MVKRQTHLKVTFIYVSRSSIFITSHTIFLDNSLPCHYTTSLGTTQKCPRRQHVHTLQLYLFLGLFTTGIRFLSKPHSFSVLSVHPLVLAYTHGFSSLIFQMARKLREINRDFSGPNLPQEFFPGLSNIKRSL